MKFTVRGGWPDVGEPEAEAVRVLGTEVTVIDTEALFWAFWLSLTVRIAR